MLNILSCVDGSEHSDSVREHSKWIAEQEDSMINLLHIVKPNPNYSYNLGDYSGVIGLNSKNILLKRLSELDEKQSFIEQNRSQIILEHHKKKLEESNFKNIHCLSYRDTVENAIQELGHKTDLIIIGKQGEQHYHNSDRLGSHVREIIQISEHPILVVPHNFSEHGIKKIAVAYDGYNDHFLSLFDTFTWLKYLPCTILSIEPNPAYFTGENFINTKNLETQLKSRPLSTSLLKLTGDPKECILKFVLEHNINLLIIGAYRHSTLTRKLLGSTTESLLRSLLIPTLIFPNKFSKK